MTEKSFYSPVQDWMKQNLQGSNAVELKLTKTNKFYLNKMEAHQLPTLYAIKHKVLVYKLPDVGYDRKPCDIIMLSGAGAFVGIIYYVPHKKKHLYLIDIDVFLEYQKEGHVSMTEEETSRLASYHHHL